MRGSTLRRLIGPMTAAARRVFAPPHAGRGGTAWRLGAAGGVVAIVAGGLWWANRPADIVVGTPPEPTTTAAAGPTIVTAPPEPEPTEPPSGVGGPAVPTLVASPPDGSPYGPAVHFVSGVPVPEHLVFILAVGSDARPGESVTRSRADSIHLLAANPRTGTGTVLGIPRDTWVRIPGRGDGKITTALALGGPDLLAATVRELTGLPVDYYVVTGFAGFEAMTNELGGVHHHVDRAMGDRASGAYFQVGWHHLDGFEALAYSRNRKDVPYGDFSRSLNQGKLLMSTLTKLRAEVGEASGIRHWLGVLVKHARLDIGFGDLERIATLARRMDPANLTNVVAPGRIGKARGQSVVFLTAEAAALFDDIRPDASIGQPAGPPPTEPPPPTTTTTTAVPPTTTTTIVESTTTTSLVEL